MERRWTAGLGGHSRVVTTALRRAPPRLGLADRLQPVLLLGAIGIGLALGWAAPGVGAAMSAGVSIGVFFLIYLVMLGVSPGAVTRASRQRRFIGVVVALNFVVNPLLAWGLGATFLHDQPDLRIGLVLFLVTPCIGWYLVFTELAGGDTELGISMLGVNLVLQVLLLPAYLALLVGDPSSVAVSTLMSSVITFLVAPATAAATTRRMWARRDRTPSTELERLHVPTLKTAALVLVLVSMFASQAMTVFDQLEVVSRLVAPIALFFAISFVLAVAISGRLQLPHEQRVLLVFTTASRNSEASLAIAATAFASPLVGLTVALGPVIELPLLLLMVRLLDRLPTAA